MRPLPALYALVFVSAFTDGSLIPLLPTFEREFDLSHVQTGALLSVTILVTIVVSIPVGMLVDRVGVKPLLLVAAACVGLSGVGLALAPAYWALLGARAVYGVGYGIIWTVVPVLLTSTRRRAAAASAAIAVGGVAGLVGPPVSGFLAELVWTGAPFALLAAACVPLTLVLALGRFEALGAAPQRLRETVSVAGQDPRILGAVVLMGVLGLANGITNLMVPLELAGNGLSAGAIGTAFSAAGVVWIAGAVLTGRVSDRRVGLLATGAGAMALGTARLVPVLSLSTVALTGFLVLSGACRAPLNSMVYVLGRSGVAVEAGGGAVVGLMNVVWGCTAFAAPLLAGALAGAGYARWAFALVAVPALGVGAWMLTAGRSAPAVALEPRLEA